MNTTTAGVHFLVFTYFTILFKGVRLRCLSAKLAYVTYKFVILEKNICVFENGNKNAFT